MKTLTAKTDGSRVKKVVLNGVDITNRTFECRVPSMPGRIGLGWARVWKHDQSGCKYLNSSKTGVARGFRFGFIRWEAA